MVHDAAQSMVRRFILRFSIDDRTGKADRGEWLALVMLLCFRSTIKARLTIIPRYRRIINMIPPATSTQILIRKISFRRSSKLPWWPWMKLRSSGRSLARPLTLGLGSLFTSSGNYQKDLDQLQANLLKGVCRRRQFLHPQRQFADSVELSYFSSNVSVEGSKWSRTQTN